MREGSKCAQVGLWPALGCIRFIGMKDKAHSDLVAEVPSWVLQVSVSSWKQLLVAVAPSLGHLHTQAPAPVGP
eukprot:1159987-Pelagomonas_calceolata.AAC.4